MKAAKALLKHAKANKKSGDLLGEQEHAAIWLQISTATINPVQKAPKPNKILLPNALMAEDRTEICIFTKDPQSDYKKSLLAAVDPVKKVIGVSKLKTKYKQYESKRQLCSSYDVFMADDRIVPLLPPLLGKQFFAKKKLPIPIDMTSKDIGAEISKAMKCTVFYPASGTCTSVKVGVCSQTAAEVVENIMAALPKIVEKIPKKWVNVKSIHLKSSESLALPIYVALTDDAVQETADEVLAAGKRVADVESDQKSAKRSKPSNKTKKNISDEDFIDIYADNDDRLLEKLSKKIGLPLAQ